MNLTISTVTDMATNILAVLLLVLIVQINARTRLPAPLPHSSTIAIDDDLPSTARAPLSATQIVDLLYDRRETSSLLAIDLHDGTAEIHAGGDVTVLRLGGPQPDASPDLPAAAGREAAVYVFDHRGYDALTRLLTGNRISWRELSVPDALRRPNSASSQSGWSLGYLELLARSPGKENFRIALAGLLGAPRPPAGANPTTSGRGTERAADPAAVEPPSSRTAARITTDLRRLLEVAALILGFGIIAVAEFSGRRRPG
jgi:hypothetical protein